MHVITHLSDKYEAMRNSENGWSEQEAGMAQLDDIVGSVMDYLKANGLDDNTIVVFTTDNGAENFTWPDGGQTPFAGGKGTALEGGFRVPAIVRWPGKVPAGKIENGIVSGLDWFPTLVAAAGDPNIVDELKAGKEIDGQTFKVHLDGYDQTDLITGKGPSARTRSSTSPNRPSRRCGSTTTSTASPTSRTAGSAARSRSTGRSSSTCGSIPFERTGMPGGGGSGSLAFYNWFATEFWRFVLVQQEVGKAAQSFIDFPPMQKGASFNMEAVKAQIEATIAAHNVGK